MVSNILDQDQRDRKEEQETQQEEINREQEQQEKNQQDLEKQLEIQRDILPNEDHYQLDPFESLAHQYNVKLDIDNALKSYDPFVDMAGKISKPKPLIDTDFDKILDNANNLTISLANADPDTLSKDKKEVAEEAIKAGVPEEATKDIQPLASTGLGASLLEGFRKSSGNLVAKSIFGVIEKIPVAEKTFLEEVASMAGELAGDIPAFALGSMFGAPAGAALGASIGSMIPGAGTAAGTAAGTLVGAGAGAMMLPTIIKTAYDEYADYVDKGGNASFGGFLESMGKVTKESLKSGAVGGLVGAASPLVSRMLPKLSKFPYMEKILSTRPGKYAAQRAGELAALTGAEMIVKRELPDAKQIGLNTAAIIGMHLGHAVAGKIGSYIEYPLVDTPTRLAERSYKFEQRMETLKKVLPETITDWIDSKYKSYEKRKAYESVLKDYLGARDKKLVESQFDWKEARARLEDKVGVLSPEVLEDMMYYYQKTGNPKYKNDTYEDVLKRTPKYAQEFMDTTVKDHLAKSLKEWNAHTETRNINPREGLEEYYLPGMYEEPTSKKAKQFLEKGLRVYNPMTNQKEFLTYNEAAIKAGLKPKFKNPIELMQRFDDINIKLMSNANLIKDLKQLQKDTGDTLYVTDADPAGYKKAKGKGYVPFQDRYLRTTKMPDGKYRTSTRPALVNPEFADTFSGVFSKEAFQTDSKFWKATDRIRQEMNFARVVGSMFHGVAETESILGQRGLKGLNLKGMINEGKSLRSSKEFMMDAAEHGLQIKKRIESESLRKGHTFIDKGLDAIARNEPTGAVKYFKKASDFLFDEYIPSAKAVSYKETVTKQLAKFQKKHGRKPNPKELTAMKRIIAEHMNNIYGGQQWETSKYFRDPKNRKRLRRALAFGDWTVSALKQATSVLKSGMHGKLAREYMAKYIISTGATASILRAIMGGLEQTDKENNSIEGVRWNPQKAYEALKDVKNLQDFFSFTHPDLPIRYGKGKDEVIRFGRDEKGVRMKGHFGKQLLETFGWVKSPLSTFFGKANPILTSGFRQAFGISPSKDGPFLEKRGWFRNRPMPWKGTRPWSQERQMERAKALIEEFVPFGFRGGIKKWVETFGGAWPTAKQYTPYKSEDDIENALLDTNKDRSLNKQTAIKALLKSNNFTDKQIDSTFSKVRRQLEREKKIAPQPKKPKVKKQTKQANIELAWVDTSKIKDDPLYKEKIHIVMKEFKKGRLHSSSGKIVKNRKQAIAIAISEAAKAVKYGSVYKSDWPE